jgi:AcrR family transcriptional regulator
MADGPARTRRTGGRNAAVAARIRAAVEELVAERGSERVTIPMVAERAGVNPTSIYRRWGDLPGMINDLATYRLDPDRPLPDHGDLAADLREWSREFLLFYSIPANAALLRGGAAASTGDETSDCMRDRRAEAAMLVERYGPRTPITVDQVVNHLVAPILYRAILMPWTLHEDLVDTLVTELFALSR